MNGARDAQGTRDRASRILIVTPTYDERDNLERFVELVFRALPEADLLVVDDASPDGTGELADQLALRDPRIRVLHRPGKLGLGTAYLDAFRKGLAEGYELLFEMDTDLSHDPSYLPDLVRALDSGADVVIGSRNVPGGGVEGWGLGRHLLSKGGSLYSRLVLGIGVHDLTSGYKGFRADALRRIGLDRVTSEGYAFQVEMTYRAIAAGCRIVEVPIVFVDRRAGASKMSRRIFAEAILRVPMLRIARIRGNL